MVLTFKNGRAKKLQPNECPECGGTFQPDRVRQAYCSLSCAPPPRAKVHPRVCPTCGETFRPDRVAQTYCSQSCGATVSQRRRQAHVRIRTSKRCPGCRTEKPLDAFGIHRANADGHKERCKECMKAVREARYRKDMANPETAKRIAAICRMSKVRQRARRTNATVEEWLHHMAMPRRQKTERERAVLSEEAKRRYRAVYRIRYLTDADYRQQLRDKARSDHKMKPWMLLARKHRRDAEQAGIEIDGSVTAEALGAIWRETTTCLYCGRDLNEQNKSVEHMQPMAKGGAHTMANLIIVCRLCNCLKNRKDWEEWIEILAEPHRTAAEARMVRARPSLIY